MAVDEMVSILMRENARLRSQLNEGLAIATALDMDNDRLRAALKKAEVSLGVYSVSDRVVLQAHRAVVEALHTRAGEQKVPAACDEYIQHGFTEVKCARCGYHSDEHSPVAGTPKPECEVCDGDGYRDLGITVVSCSNCKGTGFQASAEGKPSA